MATKVRWHRGDHKKDPDCALWRTWFSESDSGRFEIFQGRPDGKTFVYELRRPDGTRSGFRLIAEAKAAASVVSA